MTNVQASEFRSDLLETDSACNTPSFRPRSLYTYTDDPMHCYQRYSGELKHFDSAASMEPWCGTNISSNSAFTSGSLWRAPSRFNLRSHPSLSYIPSEDAFPYANEVHDTWREMDTLENALNGAVIATQYGTMSIKLHSRMRVDMTIDRAIRIINLKNNIVMSLSSTGANAALLHPNGRIHQYGSRIEILAHDVHNNHKFAKMWYKGVSFTSNKCALVYLVDAAGTRTTTDTFSDMSQDFSLPVFYNESRHGIGYQQEAMQLLQNAQYFVDDKKVQNWIINNVRISQTQDGLLRIARNSNKYQLRTSPSNGSATITTPFLHTTASLGQTSHLFVRRGERRMHYDGSSFIVRNAGHSAGFDDKNMLKVY